MNGSLLPTPGNDEKLDKPTANNNNFSTKINNNPHKPYKNRYYQPQNPNQIPLNPKLTIFIGNIPKYGACR